MQTKRYSNPAMRPFSQIHLLSVRPLKPHRSAPEIEGLVGDSEPMKALRGAILLVAGCPSTVDATCTLPRRSATAFGCSKDVVSAC